MDITVQGIKFNNEGVCNYCLNYKKKIVPLNSSNYKKKQIDFLVKKIKNFRNKKQKQYDCIVGVSGGLDSSYLIYYIIEILDLKPLLFHVDAGWNSNISSQNIEKLIDYYDLTLVTHVIDWNEMRDLHLAYLKAGVPSLDTIQDHAFFGALYQYAEKNKIKFILTGANFSTESIRPPLEWAYHASDVTQIKDIHSKFGLIKIKKFPFYDILRSRFYLRIILGVKVYYPLNYINYNKIDALKVLKDKLNWTEYASKHHESRFTAFFENYWTYQRFGHDRRKIHYSSMILSNQMKRSDAMSLIKNQPISNDELKKELLFICDKLDISRDKLNEYFNSDKKSFRDYKSKFFLIDIFTKILTLLKFEKRVF